MIRAGGALNSISGFANTVPAFSNLFKELSDAKGFHHTATHGLSAIDALLAVGGLYTNIRRAKHAKLLAEYYKNAPAKERKKMQVQRNVMLALLPLLQYANEFKHHLPHSITVDRWQDEELLTDNPYTSAASIGIHTLKLIWMEQQLKRAKAWKAAQEKVNPTDLFVVGSPVKSHAESDDTQNAG